MVSFGKNRNIGGEKNAYPKMFRFFGAMYFDELMLNTFVEKDEQGFYMKRNL